MKISRYLKDFSAALTLTALASIGAAGLAGCADDTFKIEEGTPGTLTITLGDVRTRAYENAYADPTQEATAEERQVNDLRIFGFPTEGSTGETFTRDLAVFGGLPTPAELSDGSKKYTFDDITPGKYTFYIVGNLGDQTRYITTEEQLKAVLLDNEALFKEDGYKLSDGKMNLPMYAVRDLTVSATEGKNEKMSMRFACVKLQYRILFDNNAEDFNSAEQNKTADVRPFGSQSGLVIKNVDAKQLTAKSYLVQAGDLQTTDPDFEKACGWPAYAAGWSVNDSWADNGNDYISPETGDSEFDLGGKYMCYGTMYLPERYFKGDAERSQLVLTGYRTNKTDLKAKPSTIQQLTTSAETVEYTINLGQQVDGQADQYELPRGYCFEVVGRVKKAQTTELEADVVMSEWTLHTMAGDLSHTTLEVDKTRAAVTSFENDSIAFVSNVPLENITIAAAEGSLTYEGKPIVTRYYSNDADKNANQIKLRVNTEIPYTAFGEGSGKIPTHATTTIYIQAGNIRKYIDVSYNVAPIFEITPESVVIPWQDNVAETERTRVFTYRTNLGGATFPGLTSGQRYSVSSNGSLYQNNDGELKISYEAISSSEGKLTVVAMKKPAETINFNVPVRPQAAGYEYLSTTVKVAVKPPYDTYRIYFRPINDNQDTDKNSKQTAYLADYSDYVPEFFDGYKTDNQNKIRYYIYTQMGQTNGTIPAEWVWLFSGKWETDSNQYPNLCTAASGGWYRYDLPKSTSGICQAGDDQTRKYPKPGETLIIFTTGDGKSRHRMAHEMDPGIQLYDYEDGEGYYIYDPLCDPYYKVFDDKPEIEQVLYRIFCKGSKPTGFYINYGGANDENFTIKSGDVFKVTQKTDKSGQTWWVADFYAQAPAGNYAKQVKVEFANGQKSVLFGGANYYNASNKGISRGIYDVTTQTWTMGAPDFDESTTRRLWFYTTTWTTPTAYAWTYKNGSTSNNGAWPGASLVKYGNGWWYIDVSKNLENVIFSQNGSNQAANIDITSKDVWYFKHSGGTTVEETSSHPQ